MKFLVLFLLSAILVGCGQEDTGQKPATQDEQDVKTNSPQGKMHLKYTVPEGWAKETPSSSMRVAQYRIPGDGGKDGEMAVFVFPGTGGSVRMNIDRWISQFKQVDESNSRDRAKISEETIDGLRITTVYLTGTYLQSTSMIMGGETKELPNYALLAAIAETSSDPWFFKATGPQETIDAQREAFNEFVKTFSE